MVLSTAWPEARLVITLSKEAKNTTKWFFAVLTHPLTYQAACSESCVQVHTQGAYPISWNKRAEGINLGLKKKGTIHFQRFLDWFHQLPLRRALQHFSVTVKALTQNLKSRKLTSEEPHSPFSRKPPARCTRTTAWTIHACPETAQLQVWAHLQGNQCVKVLRKSILPDAAVSWTICYRKGHWAACWLRFSKGGKRRKMSSCHTDWIHFIFIFL